MITTRQRILEMLEGRAAASAVQLSQELGLTPADIRYHLSALLAEGSIKRIEQGSNQKRGRPTWEYGLSQDYIKHNKHNLDTLSGSMLVEISVMLGIERFMDFLTRLAERIGTDGNIPTRNPSRVFYQAIQRLNGMNYQAHWEAHARAPRVIFAHCPYIAILEEHPELCQFDEVLLEKMLGAGVSQAAKRKPDRAGVCQCIFLVEKGGRDVREGVIPP